MIQRYRPGGYGAMVESEDGRYCIYSDHLTALAHERQISDDVVKDNELLKGRIERLRDALVDLMDEQNGPPLCDKRHVDAWEAAMAQAREALKEG